jgi:hypothetical protein
MSGAGTFFSFRQRSKAETVYIRIVFLQRRGFKGMRRPTPTTGICLETGPYDMPDGCTTCCPAYITGTIVKSGGSGSRQGKGSAEALPDIVGGPARSALQHGKAVWIFTISKKPRSPTAMLANG